MSQAPLPPHERTWRHPSELAAAEREAFRTSAAPSTTRLLALVAGSMGLIAVGLLVLTFAPDRDGAPIALSATTTPAGVSTRLSGVAAIGRFSSDAYAANDVATVLVEPALATPIGDGRSALITTGARPHDHGGAFQVRLTSGSVVSAAVLETTDDGLVVVTIATSEQAHEVASEPPAPHDVVTVLAHPPVTVPFGEIGLLDLAEGTPVLDRNGALVGLCTRSADGPSVLDVTRRGGDTDETTDETDDDEETSAGDTADESTGDTGDETTDETDDDETADVSDADVAATSAAP